MIPPDNSKKSDGNENGVYPVYPETENIQSI